MPHPASDRAAPERDERQVEPLLVGLRALWALGTAGLALWIMSLLPSSAPLEGGWKTPIIALELARTPADVAFLVGDDKAALRAAIDAAHAVDMAFPWAYAGLLLLTVVWLARSTRLQQAGRGGARSSGVVSSWVGGRPLLAVAFALTVLVVGADMRENSVLLALTAAVGRAAPVDALLEPLAWATWLKWGAIAALLLLLGGVAVVGRRWGWLVVALPAVVLTPAAGLSGSPTLGEAMGLSVTISIAVLVVLALVEAGQRALRRDWATSSAA